MTTLLREDVAEPRDAYRRGSGDVFDRLERLERDSLRRILVRLAELRRDVTDRLLDLPTTTIDGQEHWQATQLRAYQSELQQMVERFADRWRAEIRSDLESAADLGREQMRLLADLAQAQGTPRAVISFGPLGLLDNQVAAVVLHSADLIRSVETSVVTRVNREIQAVVFGGQRRSEAVANIRAALATQPQRVQGVRRFGSLTSQALRIEQTELIRTYNIANEFAIRQAEDELPGMMKEWIAIPDSRTDSRCRELNGRRVKPREAFPGGVTAPPLHPNCRCRVVGWLPSWGSAPLNRMRQ